jgi:hypothetical protein
MTRLFSLGLLSLLMISQAPASVVSQGPPSAELAGTWRQETQGNVSYFELTPKGDHYTAQEYGLGGVKGSARLEDGHLVIHFVHQGDNCHYTWHMRGVAGHGKFVRNTKGGGQEVIDKSFVRFIGR